jgi:hypothetical protein
MQANNALAPEESIEQELIGREILNGSNTVFSDTKVFSGDEKLVPP